MCTTPPAATSQRLAPQPSATAPIPEAQVIPSNNSLYKKDMSREKVASDSNRDIATETTERYSVFTKAEKWCIVALASYAAWFSTLSSFIYFPAIPTLSRELGVSVNKIDLTVTTYMAVATFSPMLVADAAETLGRRPVYAVALTVYFIANLAIALSKTYPALLALRALQALAISGTCYRSR